MCYFYKNILAFVVDFLLLSQNVITVRNMGMDLISFIYLNVYCINLNVSIYMYQHQ